MAAKDIYGNVTSTSRVVKVSSTDAALNLSSDGVTYVSAPTGITLSPSAGFVTFTVQDRLGRHPDFHAQRHGLRGRGRGPERGFGPGLYQCHGRGGLALYLPSTGVAGAALLLSATALDALNGHPASSNASISFSTPSSTGAFSLDGGYSWASTTTVAMASGGIDLLYRDTKAGLSQVNAASSLGSPSTSSSIVAGAPYVVAGSANPTAVLNFGPSNVSAIQALVSDAYGNPVSNTAVLFSILTNTSGASLSAASVNSNAAGIASDNYTVGSTASSANYVRASVAGIRPALINVTAVQPVRLNLSPNPATAGANVPTLFTVVSQDVASTAAITGPSSSSISISSTTASMQFSLDGLTNWMSVLDVTLSSGIARFYARDPNPTGATGDTITATDLTTSLASRARPTSTSSRPSCRSTK